VLGVVLLLVGSLTTLVSLDPGDGICRFVPCDPAVPSVGFAADPDGSIRVEVGTTAAREVDEIVVVSGADPSWRDSPVLWRIERPGGPSPGWSGSVTLGRVPDGFVETVPLTAPLTDATAVGVANACYGNLADLPAGPLPTDAVLTEYGETVPLDDFRAGADELTPCPGTSPRSPWPPGLVAAALGAGLVVAVLVRRLRLSPPNDGAACAPPRRSSPTSTGRP
jgi:hypothetical protein